MNIVYGCCCGIDVHKGTIVVCLNKGGRQELRDFGTMTDELRKLCAWLKDSRCEMAAMESTASYWKPLYNLMELNGLEAMVVNAAHMKALPGRKTDIKDAEWICDLLRHGLLKASYIPDREQRELREVARYRKSLIEERAREVNRLSKMLEGANIKLDSVLSNINGKSSRRVLDHIIAGNELTAEETAELLHGRIRQNLDQVMRAIEGTTTGLQRLLLRQVVDHIDDMTRRIGDMDDIIKGHLQKFEEAIQAIDEIPGIGRKSAESIIAEIGIEMCRFPSASHLASWAGLCPGNNESAGKRRNGKTTKGNSMLRTTLIECANSARRVKHSFFCAQFNRISIRRGKNRAVVAVAHSMLIAIYHILKDNEPYVDLGADYYERFNREKKVSFYLKKLKALGMDTTALVPC